MLRLLIDQNFDHRIVRGVQSRFEELDFVFAADAGLASADDPTLLEWCANQNRILLTHDAKTVPTFAYERLAEGKPMPGVILVRRNISIGQAIDEVLLIVQCCHEDELVGLVYDVPL